MDHLHREIDKILLFFENVQPLRNNVTNILVQVVKWHHQWVGLHLGENRLRNTMEIARFLFISSRFLF